MKKFISIFLITIILFLILIVSCKKDNDNTSNVTNKIEFGNSLSIADELSYFSASVSTTVTSLGGNTITQHGHCWSKDQNPTTENLHSLLGSLSSASTFISDLTELLPNTTYYIRAYLSHNNGTVYGSQFSLKTLKTGKPDIETLDPTDISLFSAVCGGEIVSDSGLVITESGIFWGDEENTLSITNCLGHHKDEETTEGTFTHEIAGLNENTTYYVRAYAVNEIDTSYGEIKQFLTLPLNIPSLSTSNPTDVTFNSASCGGNVTDNGNGTINAQGVVWSSSQDPTIESNEGITSDGSENGSYVSYLTGLNESTLYYVRAYARNEKGTGYGELKQITTLTLNLPSVKNLDLEGLYYDNTTNTGSAAFKGEVLDEGNGRVSSKGIVWDINQNPTIDNYTGITNNGKGLGIYSAIMADLIVGTPYYVKGYATNEKGTIYTTQIAFTIELSEPGVRTTAPYNITANTAQSGGSVDWDGYLRVTERGIVWSTDNNPSLDNYIGRDINSSGTGVFTSNITGLVEGTRYYVVAYATNQLGTGYGSIYDFVPQGPPCGELTVNYGGQTYHTVKIGEQCWMKENLNIGVRIPKNQNMVEDDLTVEKYCYDDNEENCSKYGGLYQWDEMMGYSTQEGAQGICPEGWHIPTDNEWKMLEGNIDTYYPVGSSEWNKDGFRGNDIGYKLKSTYDWKDIYGNDSGNGSDEYGFKALPGGKRNGTSYIYYGGKYGESSFWTSTQSGNDIWVRLLDQAWNSIKRTELPKSLGLYVRCIKNTSN